MPCTKWLSKDFTPTNTTQTQQHCTARTHKKRFLYILFCTLSNTSFLLGAVIVVDWLSSSFAFAQISGEILLLLLIVVTEKFLPVIRINTFLLLDHLPLHLLLLKKRPRAINMMYILRVHTKARYRSNFGLCLTLH